MTREVCYHHLFKSKQYILFVQLGFQVKKNKCGTYKVFVLFVQQEKRPNTEAPLSPTGTTILHLEGSFSKSLLLRNGAVCQSQEEALREMTPELHGTRQNAKVVARAAADGSLERSLEDQQNKAARSSSTKKALPDP